MIIITGASRGIGKYLLTRYVTDGQEVIGLYHRTKPEDYSDLMFKVDISRTSEINAFIEDLQERRPNNTVLVNCAGINYNKYAHKADPVLWADTINVNLIGTFNMINALLPIMREQGYGRIINFSSVVAQIGISGTSAYSASKSGLWGLTKSLVAENASKGITINNLNLGYFKIGMFNEVTSDLRDQIIERIPMKKFGDPKVIYEAVKFLVENDYLNGTSIDINGGLY